MINLRRENERRVIGAKYLDLMEYEISKAGRAITIAEALQEAEKDGVLTQIESIGKTPQKTINSLLHRDMKKGEKSKFVQKSQRPSTFDLREKTS